jgi:hypothetical protein
VASFKFGWIRRMRQKQILRPAYPIATRRGPKRAGSQNDTVFIERIQKLD